MLGLRKKRAQWNWGAYGKHPCARDYLSVGQGNALAQAFCSWIEKGYGALDPSIKKDGASQSWRFWSRTPRAGTVIVGLIKDSCDGIGRPYPLLLMGFGPLLEFEKRWHLIPFACDGTWTHMEQMAARRYEDVSRFNEELGTIRIPQPD